MTQSTSTGRPRTLLRDIDPRRSLSAGVMWLIIALAITFSVAAAVWVGRIARANVFEQHVRRLTLETDQLSSDLDQALASRLGAIRAARPAMSAFKDLFHELESDYPDLDWIAAADADGIVVATSGELTMGSAVGTSPWFSGGLKGPWLGRIEDARRWPGTGGIGDMAAPVRDSGGRVVGVIAARLSWRRAPNHPLRLTDESDPHAVTQAYVLSREGIVLAGPVDIYGKPWDGAAIDERAPAALRFERRPDGRLVLVSRAPLSAGGDVSKLGWQVQLSEPIERVYQRADALALRILWVSLGLGAATALLGTLGTRHLTRRLKRLTHSVALVGRNAATPMEVPAGLDEAAQLGTAFATILGDLQRERQELKTLSSELERRVAVRTQEVERLAEESRYAAVVRERLKIARDLHDTLAHSMMAMLSEIRFLRKLQAHDPSSVAAELAHAEEVAHDGLREARAAITQMRVIAVRDMGLGPALSNAFQRFIDHTGLSGEFSADPEAARFGDERAETLLRMANEALRNVERHASATRVTVALKSSHGVLELCVADNGVGFDPGTPRPGHFGIIGLREQANLIGAELRIDSKLNAGTLLTVKLRLSPIAFETRG